MAGTMNAGRGGLLLLALALALAAPGCGRRPGPPAAGVPTKDLTEEERADLAKESLALNDQAVQLYRDGNYAAATEIMEKGLAMRRRLYPPDKYPDGNAELAVSLNNLGMMLKARGEYDRAEPCLREALDMRKRQYLHDEYPDGHPELATSLNNLGALLGARGEYDTAEPYYRDALDMNKRLYPPDKYPDGHPELAKSFGSLGGLLRSRGEYGRAEPLLRGALDAYRRLYPPDKYPDGHPDLANSLANVGMIRQDQGEYGEAESFLRDALDMRKRLYPPEKYPDGHPDLAVNLNNLGALLDARGEYGAAEPYCREALDMTRRLYPPEEYPDGHPRLAGSLNTLAHLLEARGEYGKAEPFCRDALDMYRRLYPPEEFPDGHPDLANGLGNLSYLLQARGEYGKAEPYCRDALDMKRRLYPPDRFPDGHPDLAVSLDNLGVLLQARGEAGKAEPYCRAALDTYRRLYPADKYPDGHPDLAASLSNLGMMLRDQGAYAKAEPYFRDALDMNRRLYPAEKYPDGHPALAVSLDNLGGVLEGQGESGKAEPYCRDALTMRRRLYPAEKYPDGHPDLAGSLNNLGRLLCMRGEHGKAAEVLAQGAAMYDRLAVAFADNGAEAEILNLDASLPYTRSGLLAATAHLDGAGPADVYPVLWRGKSTIARALERRRSLLRATAAADEAVRTRLQKLLAVREDLARRVLLPAQPGDADRDQLLRNLSDRKERLEKELAGMLPESAREPPSFTDLADRLPNKAAFVDCYCYWDLDSKTHKWDAFHYAAFVLRKGRPVRRVELGDGAAIDKDLMDWRQDVGKGFASDAAGRLSKSLWGPIAGAMGDGVDTVYVCPDGDLGALPWPALPGDQAGRVLLEDYAFAVVPSGPFLLGQLTAPAPAGRGADVLLAVGGVRYDRDGVPADKAGKPWPNLPATQKELAAVAVQARKLAHVPEVVERSGADADVTRLLKDLPAARWTHLATHGFFAAEDTKEREHLFRPNDFLFGATSGDGRLRLGAAARNPLTQAGLVLAGANQPTDADTGVLSAEAIAGLNLDDMDLAVLSACQTGLGEAATGEGVFGLQRAFHIAGARNVVASLWTVDDESTAALMNLFYYHLWEKGEPPLEALHHAQLELYRNPAGIPALARGRGAADWDETVQALAKAPADPKESAKRPAAVKDWAAFVLSGAGR